MSRQERAYCSNWIYKRVVLEEFFGPQKCAMKSALIGWSYEHSSVDSIARCHFGFQGTYQGTRVPVSWYHIEVGVRSVADGSRDQELEPSFEAHQHGRIWPKKRSFHLKILVRRLQSASSQHVLNPNSFLPVFFGQRSIRRTWTSIGSKRSLNAWNWTWRADWAWKKGITANNEFTLWLWRSWEQCASVTTLEK